MSDFGKVARLKIPTEVMLPGLTLSPAWQLPHNVMGRCGIVIFIGVMTGRYGGVGVVKL